MGRKPRSVLPSPVGARAPASEGVALSAALAFLGLRPYFRGQLRHLFSLFAWFSFVRLLACLLVVCLFVCLLVGLLLVACCLFACLRVFRLFVCLVVACLLGLFACLAFLPVVCRFACLFGCLFVCWLLVCFVGCLFVCSSSVSLFVVRWLLFVCLFVWCSFVCLFVVSSLAWFVRLASLACTARTGTACLLVLPDLLACPFFLWLLDVSCSFTVTQPRAPYPSNSGILWRRLCFSTLVRPSDTSAPSCACGRGMFSDNNLLAVVYSHVSHLMAFEPILVEACRRSPQSPAKKKKACPRQGTSQRFWCFVERPLGAGVPGPSEAGAGGSSRSQAVHEGLEGRGVAGHQRAGCPRRGHR